MATPIGNYLGWALSNQLNQNPTMSFFEGMKAAGVPAEMQLRGAQAQQAMSELEKERRMTGAMQGIDLSKPGGFEQAIAATGKIDPILSLKLMTVKQNMDVESRKALSETMNNTTKYMGEALKTVITPQQYEAVRMNVAKMSPDIASGMPPVTDLMTPDGKLDMNKFQLLTNRTQVVQDTLAHNRALELESIRARLQAQRDAASDERQRKGFEHQIEMLDKRLAANQQNIGNAQENSGIVAEGILDGSILPSQGVRGRGKEALAVAAEVKKRGGNLAQLAIQEVAAKKWASSMNSQQMVRYRGLADSVVNTIGDVKALADQMNLSGFRPMNYAEIEGLMNTAGNTPMGQLATQYVGAVNTLKEEFANLAQGGYAPTEAAWKLANEQINKNFGVNQMHASLDEIKRLINFRTQAFENIKPWGMGGGQQQSPGGGKTPPRTVTDPKTGVSGTLMTNPDGSPQMDAGYPVYNVNGKPQQWRGGY